MDHFDYRNGALHAEAVSLTDISCADGTVRLSLKSGGVGITLVAATTSAYVRVLSFDRV